MDITALSRRLDTVAKCVPYGARLADIGSDHAYLPTFLAREGRIAHAIAVEVNQGPFESAINQVVEAELEDTVSVRLGDGLSVIKRGEVNAIVIAGMGGRLITTILEKGKDKLTADTVLILQPNIGSHLVRHFLQANQWEIFFEKMVNEDHRYYEVIVARYSNTEIKLTEKELLFGPILLKEKSLEFKEKWSDEVRKWKKILKSLNRAEQNEETIEKRREFSRNIEMAEEVLS